MIGGSRRRLDSQDPKSKDEQWKEAAEGNSCADIAKNSEEGFLVAASQGLTLRKGIL